MMMTREALAAALRKEIKDGDVYELLAALDRLSKNAVDRLREAAEDWADK
jgi:hypothetical protein